MLDCASTKPLPGVTRWLYRPSVTTTLSPVGIRPSPLALTSHSGLKPALSSVPNVSAPSRNSRHFHAFLAPTGVADVLSFRVHTHTQLHGYVSAMSSARESSQRTQGKGREKKRPQFWIRPMSIRGAKHTHMAESSRPHSGACVWHMRSGAGQGPRERVRASQSWRHPDSTCQLAGASS